MTHHHGGDADDAVAAIFGVVVLSTLFCFCCCALLCIYCICQPVFACLIGLCCSCCGRSRAEGRHTVISVTKGSAYEYESMDNSIMPAEFTPSAPVEAYSESYQSYEAVPSAPPFPAADYKGEYVGGAVPVVDAFIFPPLSPHPDHSFNHSDAVPMAKIRDVWAAVLFLVNFTVVCTTAVVAFRAHANGKYNLQAVLDTYGLGSMKVTDAAAAFFIVSVVPFVLGTIWLSLVIRHAKLMLVSVMWFGASMTAALALFFAFVGQFILFVAMVILCCLSIWYIYAVRERLDFASAVLEVACRSIKLHYGGLVATVSALALLQLVWVIVWGAAGANVFASLQEGNETVENESYFVRNNKIVCFLLLVSLYWGIMLGNAIIECVVSGIVSCWWFRPQRSNALQGSIFRAMTYSFGSLCIGSLVVSIVMAIRALFRLLRGGGSKRGAGSNLAAQCIFQVIDFFLGLIEAVVLYFNKYAFCYVAAYGENFLTSGRNVMELFQRRGFTAIINDNLMSNVFQLTVFILACSTSLFGYMIASIWTMEGGDSAVFVASLTVFGFFSGAIVGMLLLSILNSASAMVFVAFAEDPDALKVNHCDDFFTLYGNWEKMHPRTLDWIQYKSISNI